MPPRRVTSCQAQRLDSPCQWSSARGHLLGDRFAGRRQPHVREAGLFNLWDLVLHLLVPVPLVAAVPPEPCASDAVGQDDIAQGLAAWRSPGVRCACEADSLTQTRSDELSPDDLRVRWRQRWKCGVVADDGRHNALKGATAATRLPSVQLCECFAELCSASWPD